MNQKIKCNTKSEIKNFLSLHKDCDMNSESYEDGIEMIFCKSHAEYDKPSKYRKLGTYVFIDTKVMKI